LVGAAVEAEKRLGHIDSVAAPLVEVPAPAALAITANAGGVDSQDLVRYNRGEGRR
jgi:hypothetical protein